MAAPTLVTVTTALVKHPAPPPPLPPPSLLHSSAHYLVPKTGLPVGEVTFLSQWSPGALVSTVPKAAATALTPKAIAASLTPETVTQTWIQSLAMAAVMAAFV